MGRRGLDALAGRGGVQGRRGGTAPVQHPLHLHPAAVFTDGGGRWIGAALDGLVVLRRWTWPRRCPTAASAVFTDGGRLIRSGYAGYGGD
jgi:hypothetical protein